MTMQLLVITNVNKSCNVLYIVLYDSKINFYQEKKELQLELEEKGPDQFMSDVNKYWPPSVGKTILIKELKKKLLPLA